jgi:UDP-glucose 4-epimerase
VTAPSTYRGERTILFGGSGFLGPYILERCPEMISVGRRPPATSNAHVQVASLDDLRALADVDFDRVVYIIGNTDHHALEREELQPGEPTAFDYHVVPFLRTMEQIKGRAIEKLVHFSSILVYDETRLPHPVGEDAPIDPYRNRYVFSKYLAEEACRFYGRWVPIVNARFCNLYGPTPLERYDLIHVTCRKLVREGRAEVWSASPERDFIYVDDAADAIIALLFADHAGTVNLGTGTMTSVGRIVEILRELSGCPITVLDRPVSGPMRFCSDPTLLFRITGWRPKVSIEEGVRRCFEAARAWHAAP